jgi:hypothetical protein
MLGSILLKLVNLVNAVYKKATIINGVADGKITRRLDDPDSKVVSSSVTAAALESKERCQY